MAFSIFRRRTSLKVAIVGNCQSQVIAALVKNFNSSIEVLTIAVVHLLKSEDSREYLPLFDQADIIFTQIISDDYLCDFVRTNRLKEIYGSKVTTLVNLYYAGYNPDWFYIRLPEFGNLRGPMGDYQNRTLFESWQSGKTVKEASILIEDSNYNQLKYASVEENSLKELAYREQSADVKIVDFIQNRLDSEQLFFTFNHPRIDLLVEYVKRALKLREIEIRRSRHSFRSEPLGLFRPMPNPICSLKSSARSTLHQGIPFPEHKVRPDRIRPVKYNSLEITEIFFNIYDQHPDKLRK